MSCCQEPDSYGRSKIKVELDVPNYATKSDVKRGTGVDTSELVKNADLV